MDQETKQFITEQFAELRSGLREELNDDFGRQIESVVKHHVAELAGDIDRQIGVLVEHHSDEVKALMEQRDADMEVINGHFQDVKETLDEHTKILTANQETLLEHDERITTLERSR